MPQQQYNLPAYIGNRNNIGIQPNRMNLSPCSPLFNIIICLPSPSQPTSNDTIDSKERPITDPVCSSGQNSSMPGAHHTQILATAVHSEDRPALDELEKKSVPAQVCKELLNLFQI